MMDWGRITREALKQLPGIIAAVALCITAAKSGQKTETIEEQAREIVEERQTVTNLVEQVKSISTLAVEGDYE